MMRRFLMLFLLASAGCGESEQAAKKETRTVRADLVGDKGLLKDIHVGPGSSNPSMFTELLGKAYFTASDAFNGRELWVTDGTSSGTTLVANLTSGDTSFSELMAAQSFLAFIAEDGTGYHLWRLVPGTSPQKLVISNALEVNRLIALNDRIFFTALIQGQGAWLYALGPSGAPVAVAPMGGSNFAAAGGKLYFSGSSGYGNELWRLDPATMMASQVGDINPGAGSSNPRDIVEFNGDVYFTADDGTHGRELWVAPANGGAPSLFVDLVPGAGSPFSDYKAELTVAGERLFFLANRAAEGYEPCFTDGTPHSFTCFDLWPGAYSSMPASQRGMVAAGDAVYLAPRNASTGPGIHRMGPQDAAPVLLPGPTAINPTMLTAAGNVVFFRDGYDHTGEVWRADIRKVTNLGAFAATVDHTDPSPLGYLSSRGYLLLSATGATQGRELHFVDSRMPSPLQDLNGNTYQVKGEIMVPAGSFTAYFAGTDPSGDTELIKARNGSMAKIDLNWGGSSDPEFFVEMNGDIYFAATTGGALGDRELWVDRPLGATSMVRNINLVGSSNPEELVALGTNIYFTADDGSGRKLFRSDGTSAGTVSINVPNGTGIGKLTVTSNRLYFTATDSSTGEDEVWAYTPGAAAATPLLFPGNGGLGTYPTELVASGPLLYFVGWNDLVGREEVFRTSGAAPVPLSGQSWNASRLVRPEGSSLVLFTAGSRLWRVSGTSAIQVPFGLPTSSCLEPGDFVVGISGTDVFFSCNNATGDRELYRTDGTQYDHYLDVNPTASGEVAPLLLISNRLYIAANDGLAGKELHHVDISTKTLHSHFDFIPGTSSSVPRQLKRVTGGWVMVVSDGFGPATAWFGDNL